MKSCLKAIKRLTRAITKYELLVDQYENMSQQLKTSIDHTNYTATSHTRKC